MSGFIELIILSFWNRSNLTAQELGCFPFILRISSFHRLTDDFKQTEPNL